ncbi:MAG: M23 family metallopeptidase [Anaerolineae bacterium]
MYIDPRRRQRRILVLIGFLAFVCTACILFGVLFFRTPTSLFTALDLQLPRILAATAGTETPTATPTEDAGATETVRARPRPTNTRIPTKTPYPTATLRPTATPISFEQHLILGRPVGPDAFSNIPAWTYLYGDTAHGDAQVHHGEEFVNPLGTPLLATADGTVVVAGNDSGPACGADGQSLCGPITNFYGNLVVVQLDHPLGTQVIFTMCGHMRNISVKLGQHVLAGDQIGTVGDTGVAIGPHCHFEVRLGVNDYAHTRNPILWMRPLPGDGIIAGAVVDQKGNFIRSVNVSLYFDNDTQDYIQDTETYGRDADPTIAPVNSDDSLHENWAMGDLKAGKYLVRAQVGGLSYLRHVTVQEGQITFVVLGGP